ncbi:MAG: hormogonium polysaccharide biosynthesis glycosyltransferase HpsE [Cyanobacteria bacterium J06642_11]
MTDFSVVICTYNGERRLPPLLARLRTQIMTEALEWEILIVDNNSHDKTAEVIRECQNSWSKQVPLRYVFEPRQGLAYARRYAMAMVNSKLVGFLDDDTLPNSDWVYQAYSFGQQHPQVGAYGSAIVGDYATPPPEGFDRIASCLAIINRGNIPFQYGAQGVLPAGAGMVIRHQVWLECVPSEPSLSGVCSTNLKSKGEDIETLNYIRDRNWPIWHNPAMVLTHQIPQSRLEPSYLLNLFRYIGSNRFTLRCNRYRSWQKPLMLLLHCLNDLRKLILHIIA